MGQVLRIHFNDKDHSFKIVNEDPIRGETQSILVQIDDQDLTLVRRGQSWVPEAATDDEISSLAEAIGKAVALRYRI